MEKCFKQLRRKLENNLVQMEGDVSTILAVQAKLQTMTENIVRDIETQSEQLKKCIDEVVREMTGTVDNIAAENVKLLEQTRNELLFKISTCKESIKQCDVALRPLRVETGANLVSPKSVSKMVYDSIDKTTYVRPGTKVKHCTFATDTFVDLKDKIRKVMGYVKTNKERVTGDGQKSLCLTDKLKLLTTIETGAIAGDGDVNALETTSEDGATFLACFKTGRHIIRFDTRTAKQETIHVGFKVDDIAFHHEEEIFVSTPDGKWIKRLSMDGSKAKVSTLYNGDNYIHGLTISNDKRSVVACATDTPNYSDSRPLKTFILVCCLETNTISQVTIHGMVGKVYRIIQNMNDQYVLTFPKEGRVVSVNLDGHVISSFEPSQESHDTSGSERTSKRSNDKVTNPDFWPSGVCCDVNGCIYVSDWLRKRVLILDDRCKFLGHLTSELHGPNSLAVTSDRRTILIGDRERIQMWTLVK